MARTLRAPPRGRAPRAEHHTATAGLGAHGPGASAAFVRDSVAWKVARGWPQDLAEGYTLLMTNFKAVVGDAVGLTNGRIASKAAWPRT